MLSLILFVIVPLRAHAQATSGTSTPSADSLVPDPRSAALIRSRFLADFGRLAQKLTALASAIPEEKYAWRPGPEVRSVAEVYQHLLSDHFRGVAVAFGIAPVDVQSGPAAFRELPNPPSKAETLRHLRETSAFLQDRIAAIPPDSLSGVRTIFGRPSTVAATAVHMTGELHEHLGQLIAYARMIGIVPPWSS